MPDIQEYYDKEPIVQQWVKTAPQRSIQRQIEMMLRVKPAQAKAAVDLGCGGGVFTRAMKSTGRPVLGLDFSFNMVAAAQKLSQDEYYCQADAVSLPFADESVSFLLSAGLVEHVRDIPGLLANIQRVLTPGGIAVISFLNRKSIWKGFFSWRYPGGLIYYDVDEILDMTRALGFHLITTDYLHTGGPLTSYLPPFIDRLEVFPFLCIHFILTLRK